MSVKKSQVLQIHSSHFPIQIMHLWLPPITALQQESNTSHQSNHSHQPNLNLPSRASVSQQGAIILARRRRRRQVLDRSARPCLLMHMSACLSRRNNVHGAGFRNRICRACGQRIRKASLAGKDGGWSGSVRRWRRKAASNGRCDEATPGDAGAGKGA
jgi:hypothetical protein